MPLGGKRAGAGRKPHAPTDEQRKLVGDLSACGLTRPQIGKIVGVGEKTLARHYRQELNTGWLKANAAVAQSLFRMATSGSRPNVAAAIFWLKTRGGGQWRERMDVSATVRRINVRYVDEPKAISESSVSDD